MISLERLLDGLDVKVEPFVVYAVRRECFRDSGPVKAPTVHGTLSGSAVLELVGGATVRFSGESVSVLPAAGRRARIALAPGTHGTVSERRFRTAGTKIEAGPGDADSLLAFGPIRATYQGSVDLFDYLQEPLVENLAPDDPIRRSFEELLEEIWAQRPGSRAMAETLLRRCLILLLRRYFERTRCRLSWLAALEDARLGRAVAAMQDRPEQSFTLPKLAEVAGMSRSVFAARFVDALGQSPMEFLKTLRFARADKLLTHTDLPVKSVAAQVGYSSRSSFTRAFLARHGVRPTAFRAAAREPTMRPFAVYPTTPAEADRAG